MYIKFQLPPPSNHRSNNAERPIQTFKNHFIAWIFSVDKSFHLQLWYRLIQQEIISLNILWQSITNPHLSYNLTPLSPPWRRVVIHNSPNDGASWTLRVESGWYIRPSMEHYRCHKSYIPKTRVEWISDLVEFFPKTFNMLKMSSIDAIIHAAKDWIRALKNLAPTSPLVTIWNALKESLGYLADIFIKATSPEVPLRVPFNGA